MQNTPLKPKTAAPQFFCCCVPIPCGGIVLIGVVLIILLIAWLR